MAKVTTDLTVVIKTAGDAGLDKLTRTLNGLGRQAKSAAAPFDQISKELKDVQRTSVNSIANLRGYRNAWRDITQQVEIGSAAFKEATAEAARLDKQLQKAEGRQGKGRFRAGAQIAGTIAGAGVFGGVEGAAGAGIGALFGGAGGAIVGGAIGAQVGQLRQALGAVAEYGAELTKLRIALRGVTQSEQEYEKALLVVNQATKDFAIPQSLVTKQFTKLQASVSGAGGNLADTTKSFRGIIAAVRATGGSLQDVDSALTATAQVFSKGKVSAEELRQQIGERLPGAFTLFAESAGLSTKELDKALEGGKVTLQDFLRFSEDLFERYGETAQIIASGPEGAGDRLKVALEELNEKVAPELSRLGAQFQTFATNAANSLVGLFDKLGEFGREMEERAGGKLIDNQRRTLEQAKRTILDPAASELAVSFAKDAIARLTPIIQRFDFIGPPVPDAPSKLDGKLEPDPEKPDSGTTSRMRTTSQELLDLALARNQAFNDGNEIRLAELDLEIKIQKLTEQFNAGQIDFNTAQVKALAAEEQFKKTGLRLLEKERKGYRDRTKDQKEFKKELTETEKLVKSIENTLATSMASAIEGLIDGTKSLSESLSGVLRQMASLLLNFGTKSLVGSFFADGGVVAQNKIVPFASGGVVNKPTIFPMANGMGLMGEAGPEAIMPLRRGANGKLGVESSGGVGNVVVNVDAAGSKVQGDQPNAKALGSAIGAAVQAELVKQKRPGGLLS